jgi:hypothetical protein
MSSSSAYAARLKALSKAYQSTNTFKQGAVGKSVAAGNSGPVREGSSGTGYRGSIFQAAPKTTRTAASSEPKGLLNKTIEDGKKAAHSALDYISSGDSAGAPQNAGQYFLNLLSTPNYVIGDVEKGRAKVNKEHEGEKDGFGLSNPFDPNGRTGARIRSDIAAVGHGLGEGILGQRYDKTGDGKKSTPTSISGGLDALGYNKKIKGAIDKAPVNDTLKSVGKTGLDIGEDVGLDPTTYLTLGVGAGVKGAAKGAIAGARAAEDGAKVSAILKGAAKGGYEGVANRVADEAIARTVKAENRALRKSARRGVTTSVAPAAARAAEAVTPRVESVAPEAAPRVAESLVNPVAARVQAMPDAELTRLAENIGDDANHPLHEAVNQELVTRGLGKLPDEAAAPVARSLEDAADEATPVAAQPRLTEKAAIDDLLPKLTGSRTVESAPDLSTAQKILADSAKAEGAPVVAADQVRAIGDLIQSGNGKDLDLGLKTLRRDKDLNSQLLSKTVKLTGEQPMTVDKLIEKIATRRLTGSVVGEDARLTNLQAGLDNVLKQVGTAPRRTTPASLAEAIMSNVPGASLPSTPEDLFKELAAISKDERPAYIQRVLTSVQKTPVSYDDFGEAITGGINGELTNQSMRQVLIALGEVVPPKLRASDLKEMLSGRGTESYEDILRSLETPQEVEAFHGIDDATSAAADEIDVAATTAQDASQAAAQRIDELGYDPTVSDVSDFGNVVGGAVTRAVRVLTKKFADGRIAEAFDNNAWRDAWSDVTSHVSATVKRNGIGNGLARSDYVRTNALQAMRMVEDYYRGLGVIPRVIDDRAELGAALYVPISHVMESLPEDVLRDTIFPVGRETSETVRGVTVLPTVIGNATRLMRNLREASEPIETQAEALSTFLKATQGEARGTWFINTPQGQQALGKLSDTLLGDEGFWASIERAHDATKPLAIAQAAKEADGIVARLQSGILDAMARGGSRSDLADVLEQATAEANPRVLEGASPSYVTDSVRQRINQGVIEGILDPQSKWVLKSDARMANNVGKTAEKLTEDQLKTNARRAAGKTVKQSKKADRATRAATAKSGRDDLDELNTQVDQAVQAEIDAGILAPDDELGQIESWSHYLGQLGGVKFLARLGSSFSGSYGMGPILQQTLVREEGVSRKISAALAHDMMTALRGGKRADGSKVEGWDIRLQRLSGGKEKASYDQISTYAQKWWNDLAEHVPQGTSDVAATLMRQGYGQEEATMAEELHQFIQAVMDPTRRGAISRSGLTAADLRKTMQSQGFERLGMAQYMPSAGESLMDQAQIWRTFDDLEDPLNFLNRYHQAVGAAMIPQNIGQQMSKLFDHRAAGITDAAARKAGWKRLDTASESADLAKFVDPDSYFPPELIDKMKFLQHAMRASSQFTGQDAAKMVRVYDQIMRVFKSSATVWRLGHHVTNLLGDMLTAALAGVSPVNYIRGVQSIHALGHLGDADMSVLSHSNRFLDDAAGGPVEAKYLGKNVYVNIKGTMQTLDLGEVARAALRYNVAMDHNSSRDIIDSLGDQLNPGLGTRILTGNPVARADDALGRLGAVRDNVTRMTHFIDAVEKGKFNSLDEAYLSAAAKVHQWHPTVETLSAFEKKYMRRIFYFYTWSRQVTDMVVRTAFDKPGLVTIPSKIQYDTAAENGLNPESFGQIYNGDPRVASYGQTGLLGPSFLAGNTPWSKYDPAAGSNKVLASAGLTGKYPTADAALKDAIAGNMDVADMQALSKALGLEPKSGPYKRASSLISHLATDGPNAVLSNDGAANQWGFSLSSPQIDTLTTLFGGANAHPEDGGVRSAAEMGQGWFRTTVLGQLAPTFSIPASIVTGQKLGTDPASSSSALSKDGVAKYLFDQSGIPATIARGLPSRDGKGSVYNDIFPNTSTVKYGTPESLANDRDRSLLNAATGLKFNNYTSDTSAAVAKSERTAKQQKLDAADPSAAAAYSAQKAATKKQAQETAAAAKENAPKTLKQQIAAQKAEDKYQEEQAAAQQLATEQQDWPNIVLKKSGLQSYGTPEKAIQAGSIGQLSDAQMKALLASVGESYNYKRHATLIKHVQKYALEAYEAGPKE